MPLYCPMIMYSSHTVDSSPEHLSAWHAWTTPDADQTAGIPQFDYKELD